MNTEPLPGSLATVTSPPIMRASLRAMASPSRHRPLCAERYVMEFPRRAVVYCGLMLAARGKARFHPLIGESSVNRLVERFDDLGGSVPGRADADEATCLVAEHKFTQGGDIAGRSRTQMDSVFRH